MLLRFIKCLAQTWKPLGKRIVTIVGNTLVNLRSKCSLIRPHSNMIFCAHISILATMMVTERQIKRKLQSINFDWLFNLNFWKTANVF